MEDSAGGWLYADGADTRCFRCCRWCPRSVNWRPAVSLTRRRPAVESAPSSLSTKTCALSHYRPVMLGQSCPWGSILCDPIQPNPSTTSGKIWIQPNPTHRSTHPMDNSVGQLFLALDLALPLEALSWPWPCGSSPCFGLG